MALSICEAEYIAATFCVCHAIWLRNLLKKLKVSQNGAIKIYIDNKSAIDLAKNPMYHDQSKHIDTKFHFIRKCVKEGIIQLIHTKTEDLVADIFTKSLKKEIFYKLRDKFGVIPLNQV